MKVAIFCPNWIGDVAMATPALRSVRNQFPNAEIVAVLRPYVADVLEGTGLVDRIIAHQPGRGLKGLGSGLNLVSQLRRERFDAVLLLPNSWRSGMLAWASGAKKRVGYARNGRGWMLTHPVTPLPKKVPHPALEAYLRLARELGCKTVTRRMELATQPDAERQLTEFWRAQGKDPAAAVVCLNPGGAFGAAKHWPVESFAQLARRIAERQMRQVLVLCGPAERDQARQIVDQAGHPNVTSLADEVPSIGLTKAAVRRAELLVTTDSGPRHFAQPFDVPAVTLFGPTHQAWSETDAPRSLPLQVDVDCGPCQKRVCPLGHHRCMTELSVDTVYEAVVRMLARYGAERVAA